MNRPDGIKADGAAPCAPAVLWMRKGRHAGQQ